MQCETFRTQTFCLLDERLSCEYERAQMLLSGDVGFYTRHNNGQKFMFYDVKQIAVDFNYSFRILNIFDFYLKYV